jgi:hypothetical protein
VALCSDEPVPDWVHQALPGLPATMQRSGQQANAYEKAALDLVEAVLLEHRVGEEVTGTIVSVHDDDAGRGVLLVPSLGVEAPVTGDGDLPLGHEVTARLVSADPVTRTVAFAVAS